MNYFKKLIKKWKLIRRLDSRLQTVLHLFNINKFGVGIQLASLKSRKAFYSRENELKHEYIILKKALNKLKSL